MTHKVFLVDCDGVVADFVTAALKLIEEKTGDVYLHSDVKSHWNIFKALQRQDIEHILPEAISKENFCYNIPPMPGAQEGIKSLQEHGDVYMLTKPFNERNWIYERTCWIQDNLGLSHRNIIFTGAKQLVRGTTLIDDSHENLSKWQSLNAIGVPLLWDAPYNEDKKEFTRVYNWPQTLKELGLT